MKRLTLCLLLVALAALGLSQTAGAEWFFWCIPDSHNFWDTVCYWFYVR